MSGKDPHEKDFGFETKCLHSGHILTLQLPQGLFQFITSSFVFDDPEHAASLFNLQTFGNVYSRLSNPTNAVLEERMAALEDGRAAVSVSSGMAASAIALLTLCKQGDHVVASRALYGGSHSLLDFNLRRFGVESSLVVDPNDLAAFESALSQKTKAIFVETIGNPAINVIDLEKISKIAHSAGVPLIVDNTFPTPYLCQPFKWGADIVVHSMTKFLGGHGTTMGGVIVESGVFNWANGNFPDMVEPFRDIMM